MSSLLFCFQESKLTNRKLDSSWNKKNTCLEYISYKKTTLFKIFRYTRHKRTWSCQVILQIQVGFNILSQVTKDSFQNQYIQIIYQLIKYLQKHPKLELKYNKMDHDSLQILVFLAHSVKIIMLYKLVSLFSLQSKTAMLQYCISQLEKLHLEDSKDLS